MNCAPNTLSEFPELKNVLSLHVFPLLVCVFFNFLPIEVHFWVRIPVKTRGIHSGCLVARVSGRISALVGKHWTVGSEMNCLETAPGLSIGGPASRRGCFLYLGTMDTSNMKGRAQASGLAC